MCRYKPLCSVRGREDFTCMRKRRSHHRVALRSGFSTGCSHWHCLERKLGMGMATFFTGKHLHGGAGLTPGLTEAKRNIAWAGIFPEVLFGQVISSSSLMEIIYFYSSKLFPLPVDGWLQSPWYLCQWEGRDPALHILAGQVRTALTKMTSASETAAPTRGLFTL